MERLSVTPTNTQGNASGLWLSFFTTLFGTAFEFGWNLGVTNIPETYIKCWLQGVITSNTTFTIEFCEDALDLDSTGRLDDANTLWAISVSIFAIGAIVGSQIGGPMADRYGRRSTMIATAICSIVACLMQGLSRPYGSIFMLISGRILIGFTSGIYGTVAPVYLNEIAPENRKGLFGASYEFANNLGIAVAQIVGLPWFLGTSTHWTFLLAAGCIPPATHLLLMCFCPETPEYLQSRGKSEKALASGRKLYGKEYKLYEKEYAFVINTAHKDSILSTRTPDSGIELQESLTPPLVELTSALSDNINIPIYRNKPVLKILLVSMTLQAIAQFCGINAIFLYSTQILHSIGLGPVECCLGTVAFSVAGAIGAGVAGPILDRTGRRPLGFASLVGLVFCLAMAWLMLLRIGGVDMDNLVIPALALYTIIFEVGIGPIHWLFASEAFDIQYKATAQAVSSSTHWLCVCMIGMFFPHVQKLLGIHVFASFSVIAALSAVYLKYFMPETKGKTPSEIIREMGDR